MGFLDRLFGSDDAARRVPPVPPNPYAAPASPPPYPPPSGRPAAVPPPTEDERAIERYRYLLRTAPPQTIEQVHAEAFAKLSPAQRQQVLAELKAGLPPYEQPRAGDPMTLARAATRAEYMNPGFMERTFGRSGRSAPGFAPAAGGSLFGTVVGFVIGSAMVSSIMAPWPAADAGADPATDAGGDAGADTAAWGDPGSGWGGDGIGFGGDLGGGDFGGDFGF